MSGCRSARAPEHLLPPNGSQRSFLSLDCKSSVDRGPARNPARPRAFTRRLPDQADTILRERLQTINAQGPVESALRAYLISRESPSIECSEPRGHDAARGQTLGERRGWPRLIAACIAERVSLLLEAGRPMEARRSVEYLERYVDGPAKRPASAGSELTRYSVLHVSPVARGGPSRDALAAFASSTTTSGTPRRLRGYRLTIEFSGMLASTGEFTEAVILFSNALRIGAAWASAKAFSKAGCNTSALGQAFDDAGSPGSADRELLPFLGSLLAHWEGCRSAEGTSRAKAHERYSDGTGARYLGEDQPRSRQQEDRSNTEISPETVKSHVKRIFLKLAVGTRAEAVSQAKSLGLL